MLATLLAELATDEALATALDAADVCDDTTDEAVVAADPVAAEVALVVAVWPAAQDAAVGRFVTPAGTQMLSAYLSVAVSLDFCQTLFPKGPSITLMSFSREGFWGVAKAYHLGRLCHRPGRRSM